MGPSCSTLILRAGISIFSGSWFPFLMKSFLEWKEPIPHHRVRRHHHSLILATDWCRWHPQSGIAKCPHRFLPCSTQFLVANIPPNQRYNVPHRWSPCWVRAPLVESEHQISGSSPSQKKLASPPGYFANVVWREFSKWPFNWIVHLMIVQKFRIAVNIRLLYHLETCTANSPQIT